MFTSCHNKKIFFILLSLSISSIFVSSAFATISGPHRVIVDGGGGGGGPTKLNGGAAPIISPPDTSKRGTISAVITYTTDVAVGTTFSWGTSDPPTNSTTTPSGTGHTVLLTGLSANTRYYYRIEAGTGCYPTTCGTSTSFITVPASATLPTLTSNPTNTTYTLSVGQSLNGAAGIVFTATESDPGDVVKLVTTAIPSWITCDGVATYIGPVASGSVSSIRTCTGTPTSVTGSPFTLTLQAMDGDGASHAVNKTITITVTPSNNPPSATPQTVTVSKNIAKPITLTATDTDGTIASYKLMSCPAHGALSLTCPSPSPVAGTTLAVTYTPASGYTGGDSFTFTAIDTGGAEDLTPAAVTITVSNNAPVANPQSVSTSINTAKAITLTGSDSNNDPLTFSIVTPPLASQGSLSGTPPNVTFTPVTNYVGASSFTFKVNDGTVDSAPATVSITVTGTRFVNVTSTHLLTPDTNRTPGADVGDVNGDAYLDLVIAHLPSSSTSATPGTRILINDGSGHFTDGTNALGGRFRGFDGDSNDLNNPPRSNPSPPWAVPYSDAVRFGRQGTTGPNNLLFLAGWERVNESGTTYPCDLLEQSFPFRFVNVPGSGGVFAQERNAAASAPYPEFMDRSTDWTWLNCYPDGSPPINPGLAVYYGNDIEVARFGSGSTGGLYGIFNNTNQGEVLPNGAQFNHCDDVDTPYGVARKRWGDSCGVNCTKTTADNETFYDTDGVTLLGSDPLTHPWPKTSDVEIEDIDNSGGQDIFMTGSWCYDDHLNNTNPNYNHTPPTVLRNRGTSPPSFQKVTLSLLPDNLGVEPVPPYREIPGQYEEQKAQFADLDRDGKKDLITVDRTNGLCIFLNTSSAGNISFYVDTPSYICNPTGIVTEPVTIGGSTYNLYTGAKEVVVAEVTGDLYPDIILIGHGSRPIKLFKNMFGIRQPGLIITNYFDDVTATDLPNVLVDAEGVLPFDIDNDGDLDLFVYTKSGGNKLYKNTTIP